MRKSSQGPANTIWHSRPVRFVPADGNRSKRLVKPPKVAAQSAVQHQRHEGKALPSSGRSIESVATHSTALPRSSTLPSDNVSGSILLSASDLSEEEDIGSLKHHIKQECVTSLFQRSPDQTLLCHAYPSDLPTEVVAPLFHLWNSVAASILGSASGILHMQVAQHGIANTGAFHTYLMTALDVQALTAVTSRGQQPSALQVVCQSIGAQQARTLLADLTTNTKPFTMDEVLTLLQITLALATQTTEEPPSFRQRQHQGPRRAPLESLGSLDVWGSGCRFRNLHLHAMHQLIALAGGLEIFPTWARVIPSGTSLIVASQDMTTPLYSCHFNNEDFLNVFSQLRSTRVYTIAALSLKAGVARILKSFPDLESRLLHLIDDAQLCVEMTRGIVRGLEKNLHDSYLLDARKWVHHRVLSLPYPSTLAVTEQTANQSRLYETIRISLHIFSFVALFPLPTSTTPFDGLASVLLTNVDGLQHDEWESEPALLMWICTIGALAATGTSGYHHFVARAGQLSHSLRLRSWHELQQVLQSHLWYSDVSDSDGWHLWLAIQKLTAR